MNKALKRALSILLIVVVCFGVWFFVYYNRKSLDNIPSKEIAAAMDEAELNSILPGYTIEQLIQIWGAPDSSAPNEAVWQLGDNTWLVVNYKNNDIIVVCGLMGEDGER